MALPAQSESYINIYDPGRTTQHTPVLGHWPAHLLLCDQEYITYSLWGFILSRCVSLAQFPNLMRRHKKKGRAIGNASKKFSWTMNLYVSCVWRVRGIRWGGSNKFILTFRVVQKSQCTWCYAKEKYVIVAKRNKPQRPVWMVAENVAPHWKSILKPSSS